MQRCSIANFTFTMPSHFRHVLDEERLLHTWLNRCYRAAGIAVERNAALSMQREGIDVRLSKDGRSLLVDEKAQLHYIGERLPTFALEVDLLHHGHQRPGWLFDPEKRTEVYAFIFDIVLHNDERILCDEEQVASAHVVLVNRARMINALAKAGLDHTAPSRMSDELRRSADEVRIDLGGLPEGAYWVRVTDGDWVRTARVVVAR